MFRFLLRFFAVFIACSAFVGLTSHPVFADVGTGICDDNNGTCGTIGLDSSAPCNNPPLRWHGESNNYGTYVLTAQYEKTPFQAYYKKGTCYASSDTNYEDSANGYYQDSYTILGLDDIPTISLPSNGNYTFDGWTTCWAPCDTPDAVSDCSQNPVLPGFFSWSEAKCLVLSGNCTLHQCENGEWFDSDTGECKSCPDGYNYSDSGATSMSQCYKIKTVYCTPVPGTVPDNCLDTEENPAEWSESCTCNGVNSISYRVYKNGTIAQEDGEAIPDQVAPTLTCSELLSATGAPGYNDYDPDLNQCPEIDTFELTFNCNDGYTVLDESDRQAGSLITIAQEAPTCDQDVKNWTCEPENSLVEATYSEGAITSFKMPNTDVICTANYEYKVDYYCSETTNVSKKQDAVMHGENYTWWNEPTSSTCSEASTKDFNGWSCTPGGTRLAGAQGTYEWPQNMRCNATWTQKFPVYYDCANNGLGTDGSGTKPAGSNSSYAAGASVNVLAYPAGCQTPTEREADNQLGWKCVGENGDPVYSGLGNDAFTMPSQSVTCTAKWKSTAYNIRYVGCQCNNPAVPLESECNLDPSLGSVKGRDITNRVVSGENETNDKSKYYRTYTATRNVKFPQIVGTQYGQIDVAANAFGYSWFVFNRNGESRTKTWAWDVDKNPSSGGITVYTCLGDSYQVTYNCIKGTGGTQEKGPYKKQSVPTLERNACPYEPGWTFKWNCGGSDTTVIPGGSIYVDSDKVCNAEWTCDTANGYVSDGNGQCVKKYNLKFKCDNGFSGENPIREEKLSENATFNTSTVKKCTTKSCSEAVDKDTWICKKDNNGQPVSVGDDGVLTMPAADVTCTAQWTTTTLTVEYKKGNCADGSETIYSDNVNCGTTGYQIPGAARNALSFDSGTLDFVGWTTSPANGSVVNPWSGGSVTNDITVYAACRCKDGYVMNDNGQCEKVYTVTYQVGNCAAGAPYTDSRRLQSGASYTVKDFDGVKSESSWNMVPKMKFIKWTDNNGVDYLDSNKNNWTFTWSGTSDLVLTADCEDTSFVCPDGYNEYDDSFDDVTGCYKVVKVPCVQQNGQVPEFCTDPVWEECQCTQEVKYRVYAADADGNRGKMRDSTGNKTLTDVPSAPTCTKTLGNGTGAETGYSFDIETQTCPEERYELEYDCDNGEKTGDKTESHGYLDSIFDLSGNANGCVEPADWQEFDYWVCEPSDNQKELQQPQYDDDSYIDSFKMPDTKVTCTAHWKNKQYKVTYDCTDGAVKQNPGPGTRGGVSDDGKQEIINNIVYNETPFAFTKVGDECVLEGYTPAGWDCNVTLKDTDYTGHKYSYSRDVICEAKWQVEEYDLTYDCNNGGKGTEPAGGTYPYGQQDVPVEKGQGSCKSPKGQHFAGWTCDVEVVDYKFTMPRRNVVCRGGWEDSIEDITYVGCVNGTCVVRCNDGNCVSVDSSCEKVLYLNPEVDSNKLTYSNTKVVDFPGVNEKPEKYLLDEGYKFSGIWNKTDGFRTAVKITSTKLQTGSLTMCTILEPYYKVTYNCDWKHEAPVDDKIYDSRETVTVKDGSDCGDRPGYSFTKWVCEPNGKTAFDKSSGQTFQIEANTTCTAQWKEVSYRVTYDCNGKTKKTNNMVDKPIYYGDSYTFSDIDERCLHEGYTFGGWECYKTQTPNDKDNYRCPTGGDTCPDYITWDFADNLKCKALWDVDYYDVIYDKGSCADAAGVVYTDADGAAYGQNYTPSETVSGLMNTATKTGYTFVGWNTVSGQTTSNWTGEKPWARQSDLTVYAACTPNKYDVIYDKGACESKSGKNYTHKNGATYDTKYTALSGGSESSKTGIYAGTGYTFKGWSETQIPEFNDNGTLANPWTGEDPWLFTVTKTVYGICKPNTYNVIYMKGTCEVKENTGDGTFTDSVEYNTNYTVLGLDAENMAITTKPGYVFKGWKASYASQVPDYQAGYEFAPWTRTSALTLWAVCEREPYHVEYDCDAYTCDENDDTGCRTPKDNKDYYINDSVSVPINDANTCKKLGWTFNDWNCVAKDENETSLPITVIGSYAKRFTMINADAICTAKWDKDIYHVSYDCNGGTNAPTDSAGYTYGTNVETYSQYNPQKLNTCEREGYDFTVWVCGEGEEAQTVAQGGVFENITHDIVCQAQWTPKEYDIVYDSGTCAEKLENGEFYSVSELFEGALRFDGNYEIKDIADVHNLYVQRGYEFLGWSTENGGTTEEDVDDNYSVGEHGPWTTDGDLTLYAVCKKKVYNICYDFQVEHAGWKDKSAEPLYTYDVDTEMNSREVHLAVHKDVSNDRGEGKFYVFDGWYNMPGIYYRDQNNSGLEITTVPDMNAEPLDTPVSLRCDGTVVSPQCDDSEYAKCDVVLYAKWLDAGKVRFSCGVHDFIEEKEAVNDYIEAADPESVGCDLGGCDFVSWHCENYTGMPKDYVPEEDSIQVLVADTTVLCTPVKDCSGLRYDIKYHVYRNDKEEQEVMNDGKKVNVANLEPSTYSPGDKPVPYPEVSWPNCRFTGWYENPEFTGEAVTYTPALTINEEGEDIDLYGQMICEGVCNEPGHEHWFHIGNGENDKVCLYEKRPTSQTPAVRVTRSDRNAEAYYMMLSVDSRKIHDGSDKEMRVVHPNGNIYYVCDKSSCPELAN